VFTQPQRLRTAKFGALETHVAILVHPVS
jgi:hypothetical protein